MSDSSGKSKKLSSEFRERLLKESRNPFRGIRRGLWFALFGSAFIGLLIMTTRLGAGQNVSFQDAAIQISATFLFGILLWFDRSRNQ